MYLHKFKHSQTHTLSLSHTHVHMTISANGQCLVYRPLPVILPNCRLFMTITYFSSSVLSIFTPCFSLLCDKVRSVSSTKQQDNFNSQFSLVTNRNITYFIYIRHALLCDKMRSVSSTKQDNFNSQFSLITNRNITYFIYIRHVSYCINELE